MFLRPVRRDDGSGIAMKVLKQVQRGWGQGTMNPQKGGDSDKDWLDVI